MLNVLVLKPDGHASNAVVAHVDEGIARCKLRVVQRYVYTFDAADVLDVWPKFDSGKYPISRELSILYLRSGPSQVIVVEGDAAESQANDIKRSVRKHFGAGMFCNSIHVPTGSEEIRAAIAKFLHCLPTGRLYTRHADSGDTRGITGRLAALPIDTLNRAVREVWERHLQCGWAGLRLSDVSGPRVASLMAGDPHSIDYGMSVLADIFPWAPTEVMAAYLQADVQGRAPLVAGSDEAMRSVAEAIRERGLNARVDPG